MKMRYFVVLALVVLMLAVMPVSATVSYVPSTASNIYSGVTQISSSGTGSNNDALCGGGPGQVYVENPINITGFSTSGISGSASSGSWVFNVSGTITGNPATFYMGWRFLVYNSEDSSCNAAFTDFSPKYTLLASPPVTAPIANFIANPSSGYVPLTVSFTDTSTGGAGSNWSWLFGDGGTSTTESPSHVYSVPGIYTVNFSVSNAGGMSWKNVSSMITAVNTSGVTFSYTPHSGAAPLTVQFNDTTYQTPVNSWEWDFGDGWILAGSYNGAIYSSALYDPYGNPPKLSDSFPRDLIADPVHTYQAEGTYQVKFISGPTRDIGYGVAYGTVNVTGNKTVINPEAYINLYALQDSGTYYVGPHFWMQDVAGNDVALGPLDSYPYYTNPRRVGDADLGTAVPYPFNLSVGALYIATATANSTTTAFDVGNTSFRYSEPGQNVWIYLHNLPNVTPTVIPTNPVPPIPTPTLYNPCPYLWCPTPSPTITNIVTGTLTPTPTGTIVATTSPTPAPSVVTLNPTIRANNVAGSETLWFANFPTISGLIMLAVIVFLMGILMNKKKKGGKLW